MTSHSRRVSGPLDRSQAGPAVGRVPEPLDEPAGHLARDRGFPGPDSLERTWQGVDVEVLGEEPDGARLQSEQPELVLAGAGEHDHELIRQRPDDAARREHAVEAGHDGVHHSHVGPVLQGELDRLTTVLGLRDHDHPGVFEYAFDQTPRERVVVGDDHPKRGAFISICGGREGHPQLSAACPVLADLELLREPADERQPEAEARAVGARKHPSALVANGDDELAVVM